MEHTKTEKKGILISLDFKKAFDSLEWPLILRTLDTFNFGKWASSRKRFGNTSPSKGVNVLIAPPPL